MKYIFLLAFFLITCRSVTAVYPDRFDCIIGYGFYEGLHAGSEYKFKSGSQSIGLAAGYSWLKNNNQSTYSAMLIYNIPVAGKFKNDQDQFKWFLSNRAIFWNMEDDFYVWKAISLVPSVCRRFAIGNKIAMSIDLGPSFNIVLYNRRKTFMEVGWPYHVMPDFRLVWIIG